MKRAIVLCFSLLVAGSAAAEKAAPAAGKTTATEAIRNGNTRLRELLSTKAEPAKITKELRGVFDIDDLTKRALVDQWEKLTPAMRNDLVNTLRLIVERNYISQLRSNLSYEIVYSGEEPQGGDVLVKTVIKAKRGGRPVEIPVDYVMHPEGNGWRAYDVITDEVSLLKNYRSQFNRIIAKEGAAGLLKRMKTKLAQPDKNEEQ